MFSEIRIGRQIWNNSKVSSNKIRICFLSAFRYGKMANVICYDRGFKCVTVYLYKSLLNVLPLDNSQLIGLEHVIGSYCGLEKVIQSFLNLVFDFVGCHKLRYSLISVF